MVNKKYSITNILIIFIIISGCLVTTSFVHGGDFVGGSGGDWSGSGAGDSIEKPCVFTPAAGFLGSDFSGACDSDLLARYIVELTKFFFRLAIILAVLMVTIGGFQWLIAMGNASKISNAKVTIEQAIMGLVLALTAYLMFLQIDKSFVEFKTLDLNKQGEVVLKCEQFPFQALCEDQIRHPNISCAWKCSTDFSGSVICSCKSGTPHLCNPSCKSGQVCVCKDPGKAYCEIPEPGYRCDPPCPEGKACTIYSSTVDLTGKEDNKYMCIPIC